MILSTILGTLALLGVLEVRMSRITKRMVKEYLSELKPNGGSSLKDSVNRLEKAQEVQNKRLDDLFTILIKNKE